MTVQDLREALENYPETWEVGFIGDPANISVSGGWKLRDFCEPQLSIVHLEDGPTMVLLG